MRKALMTAVAALAAALLLAPVASAVDKVNTKQLRKLVTLDGILEHERALQDIAIANDGNRAAGTSGNTATVDYVANRMRRAGYRVSLVPFDFATWELLGPSTLARTAPDPKTWVEDTDYIVSQFSGSGDVTGTVFVAGNTVVPPPGGAGSSVSGCDPADFSGMPQGAIVLMQRGTCPFVDKYQNAADAGAAAALIFNDGGEGREDPLFITTPQDMPIPGVMISNDAGEEIYNQTQGGQVTLHVVVNAKTTPVQLNNVIADTPSGNKDRTIVVGAHLDSVDAGPGINDDGSGTSTQLDTAEAMMKLPQKPRNRVRFAWWNAEEEGLVGSTAYVQQQVEAGKLGQIEAMLDFDMLASPNFVRFVYDGDTSDTDPPPSGAPAGSGQIENLFLRYFDRQGQATLPTAFDGRSDYGPFIENGVPAGGIFTGAEGIKTPEQEAVFGGVAGLAYDPCYHQACDTLFNLSHQALDEMSDAVAHSVWTLARSKSPITQAQAAKVAKAKKARKANRTKTLKYRGQFRVR